MTKAQLSFESHKLKGQSISGKPLIEIVIDNEPENKDIKKARDDPSIIHFPLLTCFDHLMRHFDFNIRDTYGTRTMLDHARKN